LNASPPTQADPSVIRVEAAKVFVRALRIEAEVGVHAHEKGRRQPLVIDVELDVAAAAGDHLADTVNYETVLSSAQDVAAHGHFKLIETFAERLARALLNDSRVSRARVRVEKPEALAPQAAAGGAEIILTRT
jgi:7,8-dihydroneopterin aldolase/epimerase/oxygenase